MRKIVSLTAMLLLFFTMAIAQTREISGKILSANGDPVPFATVHVKDTKVNVVTDANGTFLLRGIKAGAVLEISSIGYVKQSLTVTAESNFTITLVTNNNLAEVVVTGAYDTKKSGRSVSYNAQVVTGEQLNTIRQTNINAALAGKVAGLQFLGQSTLKLGSTGGIRLRGGSGLSGGESAIYVVDGTILPSANDINIDDVENVTVLQGPAASAVFGSQGANGAIVITMKKGNKSSKNLGVDVNIGGQFDNVYILPNYQNSYSGGSSADMQKYVWQEGQPDAWKALNGKYYHNYDDDASWGPRMVGQEYIPWYAWYGNTKYSYKTAKLTPQPNNARDFYNTGITTNNSVSISSKAGAATDFRFSIGNIYTKGQIPSSSLIKNTANLTFSHKITQNLIVGANINYVTQNVYGLVDADGYANQSQGSFNQWFHRDLDMGIMKELQNLRTPEGIYASWNHNNPGSYSASNPVAFYGGNYWYNFYTYFNNVKNPKHNDRVYGDVSLTYKINSYLKIKGTYRKQQNTYWNETTRSSDLQTSATQTGLKAYYYTYESYSNRDNFELQASFSKKFWNDKLLVDINAGSDFFKSNFKENYANTNNGLTIPNYFAISNSVDQPSVGNNRSREAYNALYSVGSIGFKNYLFFDFTVRNDWYSTLPQKNNSVISKSFGGSFVFTDLLKPSNILKYGKIRASWGEIPQALGTSSTTFGAYRYPGFSYGVGQYQFNGNIVTSTPDQLVDPNIHGAVKTQKEIGIETKFFKDNRFGFAVTYWDGTEKDFPVSLTINGSSGFTSYLTNGGEIAKKGVDVQLNGRPVWNKNFSWEVNATWSRTIENKVISLSKDGSVKRSTAIEQSWGSTAPYVVQVEGKEWNQLYGNGIKRINGQPVLNSDGSYVNDPNVYFGSVLPLYTGGLQNSFGFLKDFTVNINLDYQVGGKFFSLSNMWGSYSGLTARTATYNDKGNPIRDAPSNGGGKLVKGVDASGHAVQYYVQAETYYHGLYDNKTFDEFVYDLSFVKLREVSLAYSLPVSKFGKLNKVISKAVFSLVARNLVLIYAQTKDFDPSEISGIGSESGQFPGTRGLGFNLKVSF